MLETVPTVLRRTGDTGRGNMLDSGMLLSINSGDATLKNLSLCFSFSHLLVCDLLLVIRNIHSASKKNRIISGQLRKEGRKEGRSKG